MPRALSDRAIVTAAVMAGMFLSAIDTTAVSTAMPRIVAALGGLPLYPWVFAVYMLASTATVPLFGYLSDVYGRKRFYLLGVGLFVTGSVLCSLSGGMVELIVYRGIQGVGAGALVPITMTIIGDLYDLERRARMQGLFSGVWGISSIVGPLLGGALTDLWSWRAIFWMNVPFGLVAAALIAIYLVDRVEENHRAPIDVPSLLALTGGVAAVLLALQQGGRSHPWSSVPILGLFVAGGAGIVLFAWRDRRSPRPILPPELLRDRIFTVASSAGFFGGAALFGLAAYVPLWVQGVYGGSATLSGTILVPMSLGWVTASIVAGRLLLRIGYRPTAAAGLVAFLAGTLLLPRMAATGSFPTLIAAMAVSGVGLGLSMTCFLIAVQNSVPKRLLGTATASVPFTRSVGGAVGVALMGAVLLHRMGAEVLSLAPEATATTAAAGPLSEGLTAALWLSVGFAGAALAVGIWLPGGRAQDLARVSRRVT